MTLPNDFLNQQPSLLKENTLVSPPAGSGLGSEDEKSLNDSKASTTRSQTDIVYVDFEPRDPENPANFSKTKKWTMTICATAFTGLTAMSVGSVATGNDSMQRDLHASSLQIAATLACYPLGFGVTPLITASLSEEFGRRPLYIVTAFINFMMCIAMALSQNIQSVIVIRFVAGAAGSTGATMVAGSVADIWATHERGFPMALFAFSALGGTGLGPAGSGYIALNPHLEWRWIQWISAIVTGIYFIVAYFVMQETRVGVILTHRARRLRKQTGDSRYIARVEEENRSLATMIWISCTRPMMLLLTEPIVAAFSLWIGFGWGILFTQLGSIELVFRELHGFNVGQVGLVYLAIFFGGVLGLIAQYGQEKMYRKYVSARGHEARLYAACVAAFLFPIGCFMYAWTLKPEITWFAPFMGLVVFIFAVFAIYLAVFAYLADVYQIYASSALAGQSLCRNLAGTAFPLFTNQMYARLTVKWSNTLFGCIAAAMAPIPIILFFWGPKIRSKSRFAKMIEKRREQQEEAEASQRSDDNLEEMGREKKGQDLAVGGDGDGKGKVEKMQSLGDEIEKRTSNEKGKEGFQIV